MECPSCVDCNLMVESGVQAIGSSNLLKADLRLSIISSEPATIDPLGIGRFTKALVSEETNEEQGETFASGLVRPDRIDAQIAKGPIG